MCPDFYLVYEYYWRQYKHGTYYMVLIFVKPSTPFNTTIHWIRFDRTINKRTSEICTVVILQIYLAKVLSENNTLL